VCVIVCDEKCEALPPSLSRARSYLGGDEQEDERMTRARTAHPSGPGHICVPRAASACSLTAFPYFPPANRPTLLSLRRSTLNPPFRRVQVLCVV